VKITIEVSMRHPIDRVWPYLLDPERWLEWVPALEQRTRLDDGPIQRGAVWKSVDRVGPFRVAFTDTLVDLEPNRRVAFAQSHPWNGWGEYVVEPTEDGGTHLRVRFEAKPTGVIRFLGWIPDGVSAYVMKKDYDRLERLLDSESDGTFDGG